MVGVLRQSLQGSASSGGCNLSAGKPKNGYLSSTEERTKEMPSADRIILENDSGRLVQLWDVMR